MKKIFVLLGAAALFAGCVTPQQQIDAHAPALNSWVGAPLKEFLDIHGTPTAMIDMIDHRIYRYDASQVASYTAPIQTYCNPNPNPYGAPFCTSYGGQTYTGTYACMFEIKVVENIIKDWNMGGNNCQMLVVRHRAG